MDELEGIKPRSEFSALMRLIPAKKPGVIMVELIFSPERLCFTNRRWPRRHSHAATDSKEHAGWHAFITTNARLFLIRA